uniref:Uncharacterized protein n=1 Tax=Oryza brachyantha TaxID=4533 RepID=J3KVG2_ORYBR
MSCGPNSVAVFQKISLLGANQKSFSSRLTLLPSLSKKLPDCVISSAKIERVLEKISALERTEALESILDQGTVTIFYADSPTNPHLKVVDVRRVAELCHHTLASPINQKPLTLGADVVLHSATKYIARHQDVIAGCVSGSEVLISRIRVWYHDLGGAINPSECGVHDHPWTEDDGKIKHNDQCKYKPTAYGVGKMSYIPLARHEPPHPYEELRLRCMANSASIQQLGLPAYTPNGQRTATNSKKKTNERNREYAHYDPLHDDAGEQDLFHDDIAKLLLVFNFCCLCFWNQTTSCFSCFIFLVLHVLLVWREPEPGP